jgi:iron-sulfur cluster assembly protein|tara:strand:+ start:785 stop:1099 length:315 start_codon:yes stop_codon:yes gene_type:complete
MINVTPEADEHLSSIINKEKAHGVLLSVKGGGCAGFSYDWSIVHEPAGEAVPLSNGTLYIDPIAVMYVLNTVLDYKKDVFGTILKLENPNVVSSCGCGESFSVA